jgi:hypothetical protein
MSQPKRWLQRAELIVTATAAALILIGYLIVRFAAT